MDKRNKQREVMRNLSHLEAYQPWISHSSMGLIRWFIGHCSEEGIEEFTEEQLRQSMYNLERKKYIKKLRLKDGRVQIEFTKEGKEYARKQDIKAFSAQRPKVWDGQWRFVTFDVPEKHRHARDAFRDILKRSGFFRVQHSVWVHPYPCEDEVDLLVESLYLRASVLQFVGSVKHDDMLREYFKKKGFKL